MKLEYSIAFATVLACGLTLAAAEISEHAASETGPSATVLACSDAPSRALADVGNALTTGSDAAVLKAALDDHARLVSCRDTRQAISTELIAADAYGDVNEPAKRCEALRDAQGQSLKIGDTSRAKLIEQTLRGC